MKNEKLKNLFEELEGKFDIYETPEGHQKRFLEKLNAERKTPVLKRKYWKPIAIAASIAVLFTLSFLSLKTGAPKNDLANISPEMKQTQLFFTTAINNELKTLKGFESPEAKIVVKDALIQMDILEKEYEKLKLDLTVSGNDKRVIHAMISNFQNRINLLKKVVEKLEKIKTLKSQKNETTL